MGFSSCYRYSNSFKRWEGDLLVQSRTQLHEKKRILFQKRKQNSHFHVVFTIWYKCGKPKAVQQVEVIASRFLKKFLSENNLMQVPAPCKIMKISICWKDHFKKLFNVCNFQKVSLLTHSLMFSRKVCVIGCWPFLLLIGKKGRFLVRTEEKNCWCEKNNELQVREACNGIFKQFDTLIMLR